VKIFKSILKLTDTRRGAALLYVLVSISFTLLFGGVFSLLLGSFAESCGAMFLMFFAFPCISAALLLCTKIPECWAIPLGAGLYYGAVVVSAGMRFLGWVESDAGRIAVGFAVSAAACYIVYLKKI